MKIRSSIIVGAIAICAVVGFRVHADTKATQGFQVIVPTTISITAPPTTAVITHDRSNNNQTFPAQNWVVRGNIPNGVHVTFSTSSAFVNTLDKTSKRNVQLGLGVDSTQGPGHWKVSQATDTTNYLANDEIAQVAAISTGAGSANFNVSVTFVTENFDLFTAGNYEVTVLGTVAAN
jgi:hypothetical protein